MQKLFIKFFKNKAKACVQSDKYWNWLKLLKDDKNTAMLNQNQTDLAFVKVGKNKVFDVFPPLLTLKMSLRAGAVVGIASRGILEKVGFIRISSH